MRIPSRIFKRFRKNFINVAILAGVILNNLGLTISAAPCDRIGRSGTAMKTSTLSIPIWAMLPVILTIETALCAVLAAAALDVFVSRPQQGGGSITTLLPGFVYASATVMKVCPGEWFGTGSWRLGVAAVCAGSVRAVTRGPACLGNRVGRSHARGAFPWGACCAGRPAAVRRPLLTGSAQRRIRDARNHPDRGAGGGNFADPARTSPNPFDSERCCQRGSGRAVLAPEVLCTRLRPGSVDTSLASFGRRDAGLRKRSAGGPGRLRRICGWGRHRGIARGGLPASRCEIRVRRSGTTWGG